MVNVSLSGIRLAQYPCWISKASLSCCSVRLKIAGKISCDEETGTSLTMIELAATAQAVAVGYVDLVVARKHRLATRERGANGERLRAPKCLEDGRPASSRGVLSVH